MPRYEYKVVPAPSKGLKGKNVKGAEARFSHALQELMNGLSGYGWEYQRAETLPSIERAGLTGSTTEWRNVLVFRRPRDADAEAFNPELLPAPQGFAPVTQNFGTAPDQDPIEAKKAEIARNPKKYEGFFQGENGVEDPDDVVSAPTLLQSLALRRKKRSKSQDVNPTPHKDEDKDNIKGNGKADAPAPDTKTDAKNDAKD